MSRDLLVRALLVERDLRVLVVHTGGVSRHASRIHGCLPTSALVLAQTITGAALIGGLGKGSQQVTLQIQGEGPVRGVFAEASAEGAIRAYVQGPHVHFAGRDPSDFSYSLGPQGHLSVLRELPNGEFYRGAIALDHPRLDRNLEEYFQVSDQIPTAVAIEVVASEEPLQPERAVGVLVQRMPGGDDETLETVRERLRQGALREAMAKGDGRGLQLAHSILDGLGTLDLLESMELEYRCRCSRERAERGVIAAGEEAILDMIAKDKGAELTCEFCKTRYSFTAEELMAILDSIREDVPES